MLLLCFTLPSSIEQSLESSLKEDFDVSLCYLLRPKRAAFTKMTLELLFHTCLVSSFNADELILENGMAILEAGLNFYMNAVGSLSTRETQNPSKNVASIEILTEIIVLFVHTISGICYYENGRKSILILPNPSQLCLNWRRCLDSQFLPSPHPVTSYHQLK